MPNADPCFRRVSGVIFVNLQPESKDRRSKRHVNSSRPVHLNLPKHIKYKIRMDKENTPSTDTLEDRFVSCRS